MWKAGHETSCQFGGSFALQVNGQLIIVIYFCFCFLLAGLENRIKISFSG